MAASANQTGAKRTKSDGDDGNGGVITINKYANRRLYNTATSSYVTLDHLCQMVKDGEDFVVYDAKTGEDITRSVLTQIIVEEEAKGHNLLPIGFLRQLISFYGDSLQMVVPGYLDHAMTTFAENQEKTRDHMRDALGGLFPFGQFEEMSKQNMAMFERAMSMFAPNLTPNQTGGGQGQGQDQSDAAPENPAAAATNDALNAMQDQLNALQQQLQSMTGTKKSD